MILLFQRPHESDSRIKNLCYRWCGVPHVGTRLRGRAVFALFPKNVQRLKILEIGCGTSYFSYELQKRGHEVTSLDSLTGISQEDIANLNKIFRKGGMVFHFVEGKATKLPFPADAFDAVIIADVIEHVKEEEKVMQEMHRVLKPNGFFIASTPAIGFHKGKFKRFFRYFHQHTLLKKLPIWNTVQLYPKVHMKSEGHLREYSLERWKKLCVKYKFSFEKAKPEYKFFGAFFVELYHTFKFLDRYGNYLFFLMYPWTFLDAVIPAKGTGIAIRARKPKK